MFEGRFYLVLLSMLKWRFITFRGVNTFRFKWCFALLIIPSLITDLKELFLFFLQSNFFDEYRIEGKDETNNIYLELMPDNLMRAMKSASSAQAVKIKLTKKHTPCLTFEITLVRYNLIQNLLF